MPNGLTSPSLPTGIFAFSGNLDDAPDGLPGIIINAQTNGFQRQLIIAGGASQAVRIYARNRNKTNTDPWPSWTIFAGEAKKIRIANNSTSTDLSIRAVHSDGSASGLTVTAQGIALHKFSVSGDASNVLKVNFLNTTTTANGTSSTTATLTPSLANYASRKLIATCNGGSNGGRCIVSAIPITANTVKINWDGNTPASGDIHISLMYWE